MDQVVRVECFDPAMSYYARLCDQNKFDQTIEDRSPTVTVRQRPSGFYDLAPIGSKESFQAKDVSNEWENTRAERRK